VRAVAVLIELDEEMEEAAACLRSATDRRLSQDRLPESAAGGAPAWRWRSRARSASSARSCSSPGNLPFKTEVSSVYIFGQLQSGNGSGAAAVSVLLLAISLGVLLAIGGFRRWRTRHDRV
jgi:sulfate transport system permease protein